MGSHFLFTCSDTFAVGLSFSHNTQRHRRTDGQTDDMPIAAHNACSTMILYDRPKFIFLQFENNLCWNVWTVDGISKIGFMPNVTAFMTFCSFHVSFDCTVVLSIA